MGEEWHYMRLSDLSMTFWDRMADEVDYSHRPYIYSQYNYGFVANRKDTIEALIEYCSNHRSMAASVIREKLEALT